MEESRAFLYGESVFVTMRIHNGKILFRNSHFSRLKTQIEEFFIRQKLNIEEEKILNNQFDNALDVTSDGIVRLTIFCDSTDELVRQKFSFDDLNFHLSSRKLTTNTSKNLMRMESFFSETYPDVKLGTYALNFFARRQAIESGFDDVLFIRNNEVLEASTSNIIFYKDKELYTPNHVLYSGNTRDVFCNSFGAKKININYDSIRSFEFAFLINSTSIITGVSKIDDNVFNVNDELIEKYKNKLIEIGLE